MPTENFRLSLRVLHCDNSVVAIDKPPGLLVHASALDAHENITVVELLRAQMGERVAPVHRLDKGTSGVLLFARGERRSGEFVQLALADTDRRVGENKPVAPSFMLASMLWHDVLDRWTKRYAAVALIVIAGLLFAKIADDVMEGSTQAFDDAVLLWLNQHASPKLTGVDRSPPRVESASRKPGRPSTACFNPSRRCGCALPKKSP